MHDFATKGTDGRQHIVWLVKLTFVINIFKKNL